jgi:hypothetical protein
MVERNRLGRTCVNTGLAILGYEWIYLPLCRLMEVAPWTPTFYALLTLAVGVMIGIGNLIVYGWPDGSVTER